MANKKEAIVKSDYLQFLKEIKEKITSARIVAYRGLNRRLIKLYWEIGENIVERQEKFGWGRGVVEKLSNDLRKEFSATKGYSAQNLWYMRQFYLEYRDFPNLQQLVGEIPWGQNLVMLSRIKDIKEREFYIRGTIQFGWSRNVLVHQIEAEAYKQTKIKKMHNFPKTLPAHLAEQADLTMKDTYTLDFLDIAEPILERKMERKLIANLKNFITELGLGFCFIGSQYPLRLKDKEYYIDLLFFHRHLRCLVAFDLKIGEFKPEYAGKMNFYLNLLDDLVRLPEENPSIGIILCKDRDRLEVEYALRGIRKPIGVSKYRLTKKLHKKFDKSLPTPEELKKGLKER
ncbi:MAG: PDDEXK nuclease domain-containing protein [bacterium]|nr:PDDEXK nuclease domain-containing protein [bacterium]